MRSSIQKDKRHVVSPICEPLLFYFHVGSGDWTQGFMLTRPACTDWAISPVHTHGSWSYIDFVQILAVMRFQMKYLDSYHSNFLSFHVDRKKGIYFQQIFIYKEYENMI